MRRAAHYLDASYGTYLGGTYANLLPTKVRALILDGNVDPVAWATGTDGSANRLGIFLRMGTDEASAAALNAFLDLCGAPRPVPARSPPVARPPPTPSGTPCWTGWPTIRSPWRGTPSPER